MRDEEVFIGGVTRTWLRERSQNERYAVWRRAKALHSAEGNHLARAIELLGLPYAEPEPLAEDDPLMARMRELIASPQARAAAVESTLDGLPAMAGIDVLMHETLGEDYRRNEAAVPTAQQLTAELMSRMGYVDAGSKPLPARCVARTGVFWKRS
jgi:hypothetical protein